MKFKFIALLLLSSFSSFAQLDRISVGSVIDYSPYLQSENGKIRLVMQQDGNLVLYRTEDMVAIWATNTNGSGAESAHLLFDGNFVLWNALHDVKWATNTSGHSNAILVLQNDGNMVMYDGDAPIWATNTVGYQRHLNRQINTTTTVTTTTVVENNRDQNWQEKERKEREWKERERKEHDGKGNETRHRSTDRLYAGTRIIRGQSIPSSDHKIKLSLDNNGELALIVVATDEILWSAMTMGSDAAYAIMQDDGNLVLYNNSQKPLWASNTYNHAKAYLVLQTDGNMVIYQNNMPLWSTGTVGWTHCPPPVREQQWLEGGKLLPGQHLYKGESIISENKKLKLTMQDNGNVVLFSNSNVASFNDALWSTDTKNTDASFAIMQHDGNLVVYNNNRKPLWSSKTNGHPGAYLIMEKGGNMVIKQDKAQLWESETEGYLIAFKRKPGKAAPHTENDKDKQLREQKAKEEQKKKDELQKEKDKQLKAINDKAQHTKDSIDKAERLKKDALALKAQKEDSLKKAMKNEKGISTPGTDAKNQKANDKKAPEKVKTAQDYEKEAQDRAKANREAADKKLQEAEEKRKAIENKK